MSEKTFASLKKMFELWSMMEPQFERQLCERECFLSAEWTEKLILPDGRRRED